jgi:hypothetical protein
MSLQSSHAVNVNAWTDHRRDRALPSIERLIRYPQPLPGRGRIDFYEPAKRNLKPEGVVCQVRDARPIRESLSIEKEGFKLLDCPTEHAGIRDVAVEGRAYLEELVPVIKKLTGARWVVPRERSLFIRDTSGVAVANRNVGKISECVHADFGYRALGQLLPSMSGIPQKYSRACIIQTWRPLSAAPQDFPMAFVDSSSVKREEVIPVDTVVGPPEMPGYMFDSLTVYPSKEHRWYYFSAMDPAEVVIWKGFDSHNQSSMNVFHVAFDDREAHPDPVPRRSIEARFFVFYDDYWSK